MEQTLIDSFQENIALIRLDGTIYATNRAWKQFARENGATEEYSDIDQNYIEILRAAGSVDEAEGIEAVLTQKVPFYDSSYACPSPQQERWYLMRVTPLRQDGNVYGALIAHRNITEEEEQRREVYDVLESMTDAFYAVDEEWRFIYLNQQASQLLRRQRQDILGKVVWDEFPEAVETNVFTTFLEVTASQKSEVLEQYYAPLETWFEVHVYPRSGGGVSVYFKDITDKKHKEAKLWQTAHYDHLTQLPNRLHLYEDLKPKVREGSPTALFFMDLNDFKMINDVYGHDKGDELLQEVANRLQSLLPPPFFISRFGGDEFVISAPYHNDEQLEADVERIANAFQDPYWVEGTNRFKVNAAIGISVFPRDAKKADELITKSDMAMYAAKKNKNTRWVYYHEEMSTEWNRRLRLEKDILHALQNDELVPYFQPEVDTFIDTVVSMELLARWQHPELGWISPLEFIPIAEDSGQLNELMKGLIRKAIKELVHWQTEYGYQGMLSVNVTAQLLAEESFCQEVLQLKEEWHLKDGIIEFELTENVQLFESPFIQQRLRILQESGFRIAMDDFGSGYSNFSYISDFPIDKIKIDKSFIDYIGESAKGEAVLDALILLSLRLGIDLVAEGVETEEQLRYLQNRECMLMQGYYFSRPMAAKDAHHYLESLFVN